MTLAVVALMKRSPFTIPGAQQPHLSGLAAPGVPDVPHNKPDDIKVTTDFLWEAREGLVPI